MAEKACDANSPMRLCSLISTYAHASTPLPRRPDLHIAASVTKLYKTINPKNMVENVP